MSTPPSTSMAPVTCPHKGLAAFGEEDAEVFFGRERETRIVTSNVRTARLTVLFAASGVGKSSLVRAGVAHQLHLSPGQAVIVADTWTGDPAAALKASAADELRRLGLAVPPTLMSLSMDEFFIAAAALDADGGALLRSPMVVILDQFEHYLFYGPSGDPARVFDEQLARTVNRTNCPVHLLLVIRDDALARLDRFSGRIPTLLNNYLRIDLLDRPAAVDAIRKPLEVYNRQHPELGPVTAEHDLVDRLIMDVRPGQQLAVQTGREGETQPAGEADHVQVEAAYLQLVLTTLWNADIRPTQRTLRAATLTSLGGAQRILKSHLDAQMRKLDRDQREVAARVFRFLVTPSGTTTALTAPDLADYGEVPLGEVEPLLERLASGDVRILRPMGAGSADSARRYEVSFDVLAAAALSWRSRYIALPTFSWSALLPALALLGLGAATEAAVAQDVIRPGNPVLLFTRGASLLVLSSLMLVQIYRWFLRFVSMTGFLSIRTYRSPLIGVVLAVLLWLLGYVTTGIDGVPWNPMWPANIRSIDFFRYVLTVLLTWAIGALAFATMQSAGQFTARYFRSFDLGLYVAFGIISVLLVAAIALFWLILPDVKLLKFVRLVP